MAEADFDESWITDAAAALGVQPPDAAGVAAILDAAAHAAHQSGDRRNAPVLTFLIGRSLVVDAPLADGISARLRQLRGEGEE